MSPQDKHLYEFGPFHLNASERVLLRDGEAVSLTPKTFDTLLVLVENAGRILERRELMARIWPDVSVDEANLSVNISMLRKFLGDTPDGGPYIDTIPKRGYRFVGEVRDLAREETTPASGQQEQLTARTERANTARQVSSFRINGIFVIIALALIIAAATIAYQVASRKNRSASSPSQIRNLAILPFRNLKPDKETDFLGFSLADAIITKLNYVNSVVVRPSSYIDKYRNREIDPKQAAAELNVDTLLTGTYVKDQSDLRIMAQLIDVRRDEILWKRPLDIKYDKLLTVQNEVAGRILDGLQLKLSPVEADHFSKEHPSDTVAYEYFLRGVDLYSSDEFRSAIKMLEKSVELDPGYALAWAHLGRAYNASASFDFGGREFHSKAEAAYEQALALDSAQIEASVFTANLFTDTNRVEQAVPLLRKLLEANSNIAEARWELGYAYRFAGMIDESIAECARARSLDPAVKINSSVFNSYLYAGQYDKFMQSLPAKDDSSFIVFYRGFGSYHLKNLDRAAVDFDRAFSMSPTLLYTGVGKALSYSIKSEKLKGLALLHDMEKGIEERGVGDAEGMYKVAEGYSVLGDQASALRMLRRGIERGFFCYPYFLTDPLLENIRREQEYKSLIEIARLRHEEFKARFF